MESKHLTPRGILLVEDDPQDAELTLAALEKFQLAPWVTIVRDGAQALDYLQYRGQYQGRTDGNPILILLDLNMPKVGGLTVLKAIRINSMLKLIPTVVFSSSRQISNLLACYQSGVNAFVVKPLDFNEYMKVVGQLVVFWATVNEPPPELRLKNMD